MREMTKIYSVRYAVTNTPYQTTFEFLQLNELQKLTGTRL